MAFHPHQAIVPVAITAPNPVFDVAAGVDGTITELRIKSGIVNATGGNIVFNVLKNGVTIYGDPGDRPVIINGSAQVIQSLDVAVSKFDDLQVVIVSGPSVGSPIGNRLKTQLIIQDEDTAGQIYQQAVACSDEITEIDATGLKHSFHINAAFRLSGLMAGLNDPSTAGDFVVDIEKNGTSIFDEDLLTIDQGDEVSVGSGTPYVLLTTPTDFAIGDRVDIIVTGFGADAAGLKVYFRGPLL